MDNSGITETRTPSQMGNVIVGAVALLGAYLILREGAITSPGVVAFFVVVLVVVIVVGMMLLTIASRRHDEHMRDATVSTGPAVANAVAAVVPAMTQAISVAVAQQLVAMQPVPPSHQLPAGRTVRMQAGNLFAPPRQTYVPPTPEPTRDPDRIELCFTDGSCQLVPRDAWDSALGMARLRRGGWSHDNGTYSVIRAWLIERGVIDTAGVWQANSRERLLQATNEG